MGDTDVDKGALPSAGLLWFVWLLGTAAWVVHLFGSYTLVEWYCQDPAVIAAGTTKGLLHGLTVVCLVLAFAAAMMCWKLIRRLDRPGLNGNKQIIAERRARFVLRSGLMLNVFMFLIIAVEGIPNVVFRLCVS